MRIESDLVDPLETLAREMDRSKSWVLNQALREYVERRAVEARRWRETEQALRDLDSGAVVDARAVHEWMESWGSSEELPVPRPRR